MEIERAISGDLNKSIEQCVNSLMEVERRVHALKAELAQTVTQMPGARTGATSLAGYAGTGPLIAGQSPLMFAPQNIPGQSPFASPFGVNPQQGINPFATQPPTGIGSPFATQGPPTGIGSSYGWPGPQVSPWQNIPQGLPLSSIGTPTPTTVNPLVLQSLLQQGIPPQVLLQQGIPPQALLQQGIPPQVLLQQGIPPQALLQQGIPPQLFQQHVPQGTPFGTPLGVHTQGAPFLQNVPFQNLQQLQNVPFPTPFQGVPFPTLQNVPFQNPQQVQNVPFPTAYQGVQGFPQVLHGNVPGYGYIW